MESIERDPKMVYLQVADHKCVEDMLSAIELETQDYIEATHTLEGLTNASKLEVFSSGFAGGFENGIGDLSSAENQTQASGMTPIMTIESNHTDSLSASTLASDATIVDEIGDQQTESQSQLTESAHKTISTTTPLPLPLLTINNGEFDSKAMPALLPVVNTFKATKRVGISENSTSSMTKEADETSDRDMMKSVANVNEVRRHPISPRISHAILEMNSESAQPDSSVSEVKLAREEVLGTETTTPESMIDARRKSSPEENEDGES